MPHLAKVADDICVIKSMHGEAINHDPVDLFSDRLGFLNTIGSWVSYGLGSDNLDLPSLLDLQQPGNPASHFTTGCGDRVFCPVDFKGQVSRTGGSDTRSLRPGRGHPFPASPYARYPGQAQPGPSGSLCRPRYPSGSPSTNWPTACRPVCLNSSTSRQRLKASSIPMVRKSEGGQYAYNCLLARRLAERGVRFIQLFHRGWDAHGGAPGRSSPMQGYGSADRRASRRPQARGMSKTPSWFGAGIRSNGLLPKLTRPIRA